MVVKATYKKGDLVRYRTAKDKIGLILGIGKHPAFNYDMKERPFYRILWCGSSGVVYAAVETIDWVCEKASP